MKYRKSYFPNIYKNSSNVTSLGKNILRMFDKRREINLKMSFVNHFNHLKKKIIMQRHYRNYINTQDNRMGRKLGNKVKRIKKY